MAQRFKADAPSAGSAWYSVQLKNENTSVEVEMVI